MILIIGLVFKRFIFVVMFKQITAAFLLFAFLVQGFSKVVVIMSFYANQSYIAQNLCENRNHLEKKCCGKCQLKKKLQQTENSNNQNNNNRNNLNEDIAFSHSYYTYLYFKSGQVIIFKEHDSAIPVGRSAFVFRPPSA